MGLEKQIILSVSTINTADEIIPPFKNVMKILAKSTKEKIFEQL